VADDGSARIKQGNAAVALDAPLLKSGVSGEELTDPLGMMRGLAVQNCLARSTIEGNLEVIHETSTSPHCASPEPQTIYHEFGDKGVLAAECGCEVFDERVEETIARFRFHALDDLAQRRVIGGGVGRGLLRTHQREVRFDSPGLVTHSILVAIRPYSNGNVETAPPETHLRYGTIRWLRRFQHGRIN